MLSYFRYKLLLRKIEKHLQDLDKRKPLNTVEAHESGEMGVYIEESNDLYEWKRLVQTDYYRKKADKLLVQMPSIEDATMYEQVEWDKDPKQPRYLTDKGFKEIRDAVREEQKHRREAFGYWFGISAGIIGALTGLVSVLKG
ncbi:hypothetical protein PSCICO_31900 [Pseudomonas cichorii]|uniref:hypothetical protein n=1 Tax=Pseudomonas cichorii TaxID=36746 RepID=UPI00190FC9D2|nr:hypothetical protein [Pseudomonas cichorii]GFM87791.1 hypothetical protein PSCICO_31900 [Pseudomonas cichorii]